MSGHIVQSFKPASTLSAYRCVALNGTANTVAYPANNQALPVGVTIDEAKDTVTAIPVAVAGSRVLLFFNDTVTSGALVQSDSSGRGVPFTLANTTTALTLASAYVGHLIGASVAATGTIAEILVAPGYDRE